jgi:peptidoglycan/LPS O-acetylase OafA/YrhL
MQYRKEIDGLRAFAVLSVIFFHAGFSVFSGGFIGVDVFFVISGYLITTILLTELKQGNFLFLKFYARRASRILPVLFLVMLACIPFAWFLLLPHDLLSFSKSLIAASTFVANIFFWSERGYFGTSGELKPLLHLWSLSIEEQYYFLFPILLVLFARNRVVRNSLLLILLILSFSTCVWLTSIHIDSAFFLLPTRFWELLVGSFVAIYLYENSSANIDRSGKYLQMFYGVLGAFLIFYSVFTFDKKTVFPGYTAVMPVLGTALIIIFGKSDTLVGKFFGLKIFVFIGLLSYSAYLWHQPVFAFFRYSGLELTYISSFLLISIIFIISFFSWKYIEQPFRNQNYNRKIIFCATFISIFLFIIIGLTIIANKGFIQRYSKHDALILNNFVDANNYVSDRFDSIKLTNFDLNDKTKKKILVIGDSYGKDLVNSVFESQLKSKIIISTYQINSECGNLYLKEDFTGLIDVAKLPRCQMLGWYEDKNLVALIKQADQIWLASSWSMWVAERLPKSIENLKKDFGKPVLVFGTKNFGEINLQTLYSIPVDRRSGYLSVVKQSSFEVQNFMRLTVPPDQYVDLGSIICGQEIVFARCRLFNDLGEPLSFDGGHLTRAGAQFLGRELLISSSVVKSLD